MDDHAHVLALHCEHGKPADGSCSVCMERSSAVIDDITALFHKHGVPQERRWTMLLGHAVGGLMAAGVSLDGIRTETERIYYVVEKIAGGRARAQEPRPNPGIPLWGAIHCVATWGSGLLWAQGRVVWAVLACAFGLWSLAWMVGLIVGREKQQKGLE